MSNNEQHITVDKRMMLSALIQSIIDSQGRDAVAIEKLFNSMQLPQSDKSYWSISMPKLWSNESTSGMTNVGEESFNDKNDDESIYEYSSDKRPFVRVGRYKIFLMKNAMRVYKLGDEPLLMMTDEDEAEYMYLKQNGRDIEVGLGFRKALNILFLTVSSIKEVVFERHSFPLDDAI